MTKSQWDATDLVKVFVGEKKMGNFGEKLGNLCENGEIFGKKLVKVVSRMATATINILASPIFHSTLSISQCRSRVFFPPLINAEKQPRMISQLQKERAGAVKDGWLSIQGAAAAGAGVESALSRSEFVLKSETLRKIAREARSSTPRTGRVFVPGSSGRGARRGRKEGAAAAVSRTYFRANVGTCTP